MSHPSGPVQGHSGGRIASLDGLRALALLIIIGYHFGIGWLPGGFFSLDIFYVLSGFLITGLLLSEYRRRDSIKLSAFWLRRARRLLPCLMLVLVATSLCVRYLAAPGTYPDFRMDSLAALFYFSNWWQIAVSSNYFVATGAVSPLTHTWSLAVEEQFYLVWPLVVLAVLHLSRSFHRGVRTLLAVSAVGAVASCVEMALLYSPTANLTRLYFGTDTHAQSILIGATLACSITLVQLRRHQEGMAPSVSSRRARWAFSVLGLVGFGVVAYLSVHFTGLSSFDYRGGFAISSLAAAAILLSALCAVGGPVSRLLGLRPMVWFGMISYGGYLWHFPVYIFVNSARTGISGLPLMALQFTITVVLAASSFYLVERPVMERRFWRTTKAALAGVSATAATVGVVLVTTAVLASATAAPIRHFDSQTARQGPPKMLVLGDSTGYTLGFALSATRPKETTVVNNAIFGCGLAIGTYASEDNSAATGLPMFPGCNSNEPASQQWPARYVNSVKGIKRGDLVVFLAGDWEVQDIERNGKWFNITQPAFRRYERSQMRKLISIATSHGAHLDLLTMPAMADDYDTSGAWRSLPGNSAKRRNLYNGLLRNVAAGYPNRVSVIDYGKILSPDGQFHGYLDGVQVRTADGIHTPSYAPGNPFAGNSTKAVADAFYDWISPRLWPLLLKSIRPGTVATPAQS